MPASSGDFAILNLKVVEGEGGVYAPGSRATRGITLEVTDESGRPVPGVSVSFQLPSEGASGEFSSGSRTEIGTTQADGRVSVWGMRWNKVPGTVSVRITAAKDTVRAGLVSTQYIDAAAANDNSSRIARGGHSKMVFIALAVAGAAGAGVAAGALRNSKAAAATPVQAVTIGTPVAIIGGPQ